MLWAAYQRCRLQNRRILSVPLPRFRRAVVIQAEKIRQHFLLDLVADCETFSGDRSVSSATQSVGLTMSGKCDNTKFAPRVVT